MLITDRKEGLKRVFSRKSALSESAKKSVEDIISAVKRDGDAALFEYAAKFDGVNLNAGNILISKEEIEKAYESVSDELLGALRRAKKNIENYNKKHLLPGELSESTPGGMSGYMIRPVD